jgi:hypothetical protein
MDAVAYFKNVASTNPTSYMYIELGDDNVFKT